MSTLWEQLCYSRQQSQWIPGQNSNVNFNNGKNSFNDSSKCLLCSKYGSSMCVCVYVCVGQVRHGAREITPGVLGYLNVSSLLDSVS